MPPILSTLFARYRRMSWGERGYALIVVAAVIVFGYFGINHWRVSNYERLNRRITAAGAVPTRSVNLLATEEDAYFLALLGDFSSVAITGIVGNGINGNVDVSFLRELRHFPEINRLRLMNANLKPEDFQTIYELENLRWLNLAFNPLTDADLAGVENLQDLDSLELQFTSLTDASIPRLAALPGLSSIDISGTDITPAGAERLRAEYRLAQGTQATTTVHYRPAPSPRFRAAVLRLLPTKAYGVNNRNPNGGMRLQFQPELWKGHEQDIPLVAELADVDTVSIQGMPISNEMLDAVAKLPKLRHLNISDTSTADVDLSRLRSCRELRVLRLGGMPLEEKFVSSLAKIDTLETIQIFNCKLTPGACRALANLKSVQSLYLRQLTVEPDAFEHLLLALERFSRLRLLDLTQVPIDNETVPHLARLKQLLSLGLNSKQIDDDALPVLRTFTHLKQLDISGSEISLPSKDNPQDGATRLETALLAAKVRVVHRKSKNFLYPLNFDELTSKPAMEPSLPPAPGASAAPVGVQMNLKTPSR